MSYSTIRLCEHCIEGIKSHGEPVFVGPYVEFDPEIPETSTCEWCEETGFDDLRECHF